MFAVPDRRLSLWQSSVAETLSKHPDAFPLLVQLRGLEAPLAQTPPSDLIKEAVTKALLELYSGARRTPP
jgi:hypothetical protein